MNFNYTFLAHNDITDIASLELKELFIHSSFKKSQGFPGGSYATIFVKAVTDNEFRVKRE